MPQSCAAALQLLTRKEHQVRLHEVPQGRAAVLRGCADLDELQRATN
jgi:hypothetical protein